MRAVKVLIAGWLAVLLFAAVAVVGAAVSDASEAGCHEGDACWDCETMGNRICGSDRWVQIVQYQRSSAGLSAIVTRQSPRVAARRFYNAPGRVCVLAVRRHDGSIDRYREGTVCHR
jgi:hypothetical protein